jgi:hypothetical protein
MPAASALIEVPTECGGTTTRNGQQHFDVLPAEPLAISLEESGSCAADKIGHLQGRPIHLRFPQLAFQLQRVQRTGRRFQVTFGEMQVDGRFFQIVMGLTGSEWCGDRRRPRVDEWRNNAAYLVQELLRHSTLRSTVDVYTQAVTPAKHAAQAAVVSLLFSSNSSCGSPSARQDAVSG